MDATCRRMCHPVALPVCCCCCCCLGTSLRRATMQDAAVETPRHKRCNGSSDTMPHYGPQMKESALIRAAHNGHLATVRFLLQAGADVNALDLVRNEACERAN